MPEPLSIVFDYAQRRVKAGGATIAIQGLDWNGTPWSGTFIDNVTNTLMLRPMCFYDAWYTSNAGIYTKLSIASGYQVKTPAKWFEVENFVGAGKFLQCDTPSGEYARTSTALDLNRGVWLATHVYDAGDDHLLLEAGWSNSETPTAETAAVGFKVYARGRIEVYRDGTYIDGGNLTPNSNGVLSMAILPMRRKELVFVAPKNEAGFRVVFDDIDEDEASPIITPDDTKFFVAAGSSASLQVQFAPIQYPTTGYATSLRYVFGTPPRSGAALYNEWENAMFPLITNANIHGDDAFVRDFSGEVPVAVCGVTAISLRDEDGAALFVPNDERTATRARIELWGNGQYTPSIFGAVLEYSAQGVFTDATQEFDATDSVLKGSRITLTVPDDGFGATIAAEIINPVELEANVRQLRVQPYKPCGLKLGNLFVFNGVSRRPRFSDAIVAEAQRMRLEAVTVLSLLDDLRFNDRIPMDGWVFCRSSTQFSAMRWLFEQIGVLPEYMVFSNFNNEDGTPYRLGEVPHDRNQEWNFFIERGDTGRDVFNKLLRVAADAVYGTHPAITGTQLWFRKLSDLPTEPVITLYRSIADVMEHMDVADEDAFRYVYNDFSEEPLDAEANEIRALGIDPRTGNIISAFIVDEAMQDPTLAPDLRPLGWSGVRKQIGYQSRMIRTLADAQRIIEALVPIAMEQNKICEWSCPDFALYDDGAGNMLPGWRMDMFRLAGALDGEDIDRHCSSFTMTSLLEDPTNIARETNYTGGTLVGRGGRSLAEIQNNARMRNQKLGINDLAAPTSIYSAVRSVVQVARS